jgi:hypothetical protein
MQGARNRAPLSAGEKCNQFEAQVRSGAERSQALEPCGLEVGSSCREVAVPG